MTRSVPAHIWDRACFYHERLLNASRNNHHAAEATYRSKLAALREAHPDEWPLITRAMAEGTKPPLALPRPGEKAPRLSNPPFWISGNHVPLPPGCNPPQHTVEELWHRFSVSLPPILAEQVLAISTQVNRPVFLVLADLVDYYFQQAPEAIR